MSGSRHGSINGAVRGARRALGAALRGLAAAALVALAPAPPALAQGAAPSAAAPAQAQGAAPANSEGWGRLALATGDGYPPFTALDLPNRGFATEVVERAFARAGVPVDIEFLPWKRGYEHTKILKFHATFPYIVNDERKADFIYSEPIYVVRSLWFVRKSSDLAEGTPEELEGRALCRPKGYDIEEINRYMGGRPFKLYQPDDMDTCYRVLNAGRVDAVPIGSLVGWATAEKELGSRDSIRTLPTPLGGEGQHLIVSKAHPRGRELVDLFNKSLAEMRADGEWESIRARHLD